MFEGGAPAGFGSIGTCRALRHRPPRGCCVGDRVPRLQDQHLEPVPAKRRRVMGGRPPFAPSE